jgi:hypothetical protein
VVPAKEASKSPLSSCPVVTPDESTHHAEQARVIIQSELDGNERMNRERQAILKSALEFVNSMARGANSGPDEAPTFDVPHGECANIPESIEPSPELLYMLLRGNCISISYCEGLYSQKGRVHHYRRNAAQHTLARPYLQQSFTENGVQLPRW